MIILNNINSDETSQTFSFQGGSAVLVVRADDFGGGTVTLETRSKNDTEGRFKEISSFTSDGTEKIFSTITGLDFRVVLSGATSPSNVFVETIGSSAKAVPLPAFNPNLPLTIPNLEVWLDASDTDTVTLNGDNVSQWDDKSPNGNDVLQVTAANQPLYTSFKNGLNVMTYDGVTDRLEGSSFTFPTNMTVICVVSHDNWTASGDGLQFIINSGGFSGVKGVAIGRAGSSLNEFNPQSIMSVGDGFNTGRGPRAGGSYGSLSDGQFIVLKTALSSTTADIKIDGTPITLDVSVTGTIADTFLLVGGINQNWPGNIAEIVIYGRDLSSSEVDQVEAFLNTKWAIF